MPTQDYRNEKDEKIPGNTTVIGSNLGWSKGALMYWAWKEGKEGRDFRQTRDTAADAGTLCHAMIEADIKGKPLPPPAVAYPPGVVAKAETGFLNFLEWKKMYGLKLITMEVPLVSEKYQFGTTIDILAEVAGKRSIVECKTSNDVYEDMLIQMAAQREAWDENHPTEKIQSLHLLKVNKEVAAFSHHFWDNLDVGWQAFVALRELHDLHKTLKKLK